MATPTPSPAHASVTFVRIAGFAKRAVAEQAALKERLEGRARTALSAIPDSDRAVLDADDGIAVVLFGPPSRSLDVMQVLRGADQAFQVGINYGPLARTARGSDAAVFGDGLAAAAAAARFATPERPLVTQDFARMLAASDPARARGLAPAGDFTDTRVRLHSLYAPDAARERILRRRYLRIAASGIVAILLLGTAGRFMREWLFPPAPGVVILAIKPRGEVFVDGALRGRTPPLTRLELAPGRHTIVVRHPGFPPLERSVDLKAGEQASIAHTFVAARAEPRSNFWRDLRRRFGGS